MKAAHRILLSVLTILVALSWISLAIGEDAYLYRLVSENKPLRELVTVTYTYEELQEIDAQKFDYDELNEKYPVECLRWFGWERYRVVYQGDGCYLEIRLQEDGSYSSSWLVVPEHPLEVFSTDLFGTHAYDITQMDKSGVYGFPSGTTSPDMGSTHFTTDGYRIILRYNQFYSLNGIKIEYI